MKNIHQVGIQAYEIELANRKSVMFRIRDIPKENLPAMITILDNLNPGEIA